MKEQPYIRPITAMEPKATFVVTERPLVPSWVAWYARQMLSAAVLMACGALGLTLLALWETR